MFHGDKPGPTGKELAPALELAESLLGPADLGPPEGEPEKGGLTGGNDLALFLIHLELKGLFQKALNALRHPFSHTQGFHQSGEVIRITAEPEATLFEFLVQVVQDYVGE